MAVGASGTWLWTVRKEHREMKSAVATYYASLCTGGGTYPLDSNDFRLMLVRLRENGYIDQAYRLEELARLAPVKQAWDTTEIRAYMDQLLCTGNGFYRVKKFLRKKIWGSTYT